MYRLPFSPSVSKIGMVKSDARALGFPRARRLRPGGAGGGGGLSMRRAARSSGSTPHAAQLAACGTDGSTTSNAAWRTHPRRPAEPDYALTSIPHQPDCSIARVQQRMDELIQALHGWDDLRAGAQPQEQGDRQQQGLQDVQEVLRPDIAGELALVDLVHLPGNG